MAKLWKLKAEIPEEISEKLKEYPKLLRQLLYSRGLLEKQEIEDFLNPQYTNLHNPFLFQDMQKAVDRIWQAIEKKEKICIYGDYDADAVTANAVLRQTFKVLNHEQIESYIPDRFTEGYGVNIEALEKIHDAGAKVIITVDCGTNSVDAAEFCKENNIDFIITDHHELIGPKPGALALINPKNPDDAYPYKEITGVGVAFKLATALLSDYSKVTKQLSSRPSPDLRRGASRDPQQSQGVDSGHSASQTPVLNSGMTQGGYAGGYEKWLLDLVAIGTVADCHSLLGENRILVKYGLKVLAKSKWVGLRAIMQLAGIDVTAKEPDTYTLGFVIAPRLNAAGRLEHADQALDVLLQQDAQSALVKAQSLEEVNKRRQDITARIVSEAREKALHFKDRKVLVLANEDWHKGVVGLVAGRMAEELYKPVIILEKAEEFSTGSARTVGDFNVVEALKFSAEYLVRFGGHKQAAGLTLRTEHFELFYAKVLEYAEKNIEQNTTPTLSLEAELQSDQLSIINYQLLQQLEPYGVGNSSPKFLVKNLEVVSTRLVGKEGKHLQLKLKAEGKEISAINFSANDFAKSLKVGDTIDVAGELLEDGWNGRKEVKLKIIDIRK